VVRPAPDRPRRLVYLGTPDVAVPPLRALHAAGFDIPLVVTRADKKRGRGGELSPSPVRAAAQQLAIPTTTDVDAALDVGAELGVVVAFGRIIKPHVLDALPMVNLHFSLLPRWRGAAPVERAILAGDPETGVCLMEVAEGLDEGGVYRRLATPIDPDETLDELRGRLVALGSTQLVDALRDGLGDPEPQEGDVTYAEKIAKAEHAIDWAGPASLVHATVRIGDAWTTVAGRRLKVHRTSILERGDLSPGQTDGTAVGTGTTAIELVEVQPEGKPRRAGRDWANGAQLGPDDRLGG
jgi:methionyl-tRNA formyltransferase